ncbi:UBA domain-containing protein [Plectosphaerella plurivora]|uniref:UBA domain-containing protein n=1 Tax=Plectosphaerella plurivora TaxID=936078 RepID=A0A9P8V5X1_9PEZI|nr:UBA domain-containing protein [Plectosphaerella plurivora]
MSAEAGGAESARALNLTSEEKRAFGQLFRQADTDSVGVVTGENAVRFFEKTRLDQRILGEIWQIADSENRGFLTPAGFSIVLRLIGHAQHGREPSVEMAAQPAPIPQFEGLQPVAVSSPAQAASALQPQGTGGPVRIPPLTPEKVGQYAGLFERQSLLPGGLLPGDQAKSIFEKSGLPNEALGRIWQLADTESRGALVQTEFVIAMHLLTSMKSGALRGLPNILPAPLYEAATRRVGPPRATPTGPLSAIPRQMSGSQPLRMGSPLGRTPLTAQTTGGVASDWLVTPTDKARFDQLFEDLDKSRKGFITGEEAVPFLSQSNLPEDTLAQIWDLADFTSEGRLNRDTFAVAMYLIRQQRTKSEPLGSSLPPNLIPPSMRHARPQPSASPFDEPPMRAQTAASPPPPPPAPKSALDDLFGLDTPPSSSPAGLQVAQTTGGSNVDPFASGPIVPSSPAKPSPTTTQFKPFVPSSSFGRGLTAQPTGDSTGSATNSNKQTNNRASEDLLGDNDPEVSKRLTNETAELANLSNQVSSLSKQMQEVQGQRNATQQEFNQASAQKKNFEQRLTQLRALYEKEAGDLEKHQDQLRVARADTQKLQGECMTLDTTYRDLQIQHKQVATALEADRQENMTLKEKIRAVNTEIGQLKPQIEKLKSEARQQKGLVAINKKQLSTNEAERDKLQGELSDLTKNNYSGMVSRQDTGSSLPGSVASPAASVASANNPFFKRTGSTDIMGAFASPTGKQSTDRSFDDIFGPSETASPAPGGSPPPLFKAQNTGASTGSIGSYSTPPAASPVLSRQPTLAAEPPAPAESRQISSSFLPFTSVPESLSSSRAVSPPASQNEEAHETVTTPTQAPPGAFPTDVSTAPTAAITDAFPNVSQASNDEQPSDPANSKAIDPFASTDQDKAKADFENAFASFTKAHKSPEPAKDETAKSPTFDSEFPPISELERDDDDSDTASEQGGFEDDFASASFPASKPVNTVATVASPPSGSNVETAVPPHDPSQTEEKSPKDVSPASTLPDAKPTAAEVDDIFGTASTTAPIASQPIKPQPSGGKNAFDDEDDFEGLEDAKEGSTDDDFQAISRSGFDDFNAVFDSSPQQGQNKTEAKQPSFGQEDSYDFGSVSQASATAPVAAAAAEVGQQKEDPAAAHDWDAIFATLDTPTVTANGKPQGPEETVQAENRPSAGRTMTTESKGDDPILKNLTSMGYSRSDALSALEKYDYNLERAANFLASQS